MRSLVCALLTMSAAAAILTLALRLLRPLLVKKLSAAARAGAWCVVLAASLIPLRVTLPRAAPMPFPTVREAVERTVASPPPLTAEAAPSVPQASDAPALPQAQAHAPSLDVWTAAAAIWGLGAAVFLAWSVASYLRFARRLRVSATPARENELALLGTDAVRVKLLRSGGAPTPILLGLLRPRVYLPEREYDGDALRAALLHELAHLRRRDILVKWLALFANAAHWFNPALYLLRRELARECELAADADALRHLGNPDTCARAAYGNALLDLASPHGKIPHGAAGATLCADKQKLKERLEAIMHYKITTRGSAILAAALLFVLALTAAACGAARATDTDALPGGNPTDVSDPLPTEVALPTAPPEFTPPELYLWPVPSSNEVTGAFGTRYHPIEEVYSTHNGIDIAADEGAEVFAAADGIVLFAGFTEPDGNVVILSHRGGVTTTYANLSAHAVTNERATQAGDTILAGALVGYVGQTEGIAGESVNVNSTGPHLHFEIAVDGVPIDPVPHLDVNRLTAQPQPDRLFAG